MFEFGNLHYSSNSHLWGKQAIPKLRLLSDEEKVQKLVTPLKNCFHLKSGSGNDTSSHDSSALCLCQELDQLIGFFCGGFVGCFLGFFAAKQLKHPALADLQQSRAPYVRLCLDTPTGSGSGRRTNLSLFWSPWDCPKAFSLCSWCSGKKKLSLTLLVCILGHTGFTHNLHKQSWWWRDLCPPQALLSSLMAPSAGLGA